MNQYPWTAPNEIKAGRATGYNIIYLWMTLGKEKIAQAWNFRSIKIYFYRLTWYKGNPQLWKQF